LATVVTRLMLLLLALGVSALAPTAAARAQDAGKVKQAAFVIDANTGRVLHEQFADAPRYPASLTKMMTLYMVFGEIDQGRLSFDSKITVSARAAGVAPSKLDLDAGEEIEVIDAVKALITKSANDMAVALAEHIGGSEAQFARLMTERARQIGMRSTTFRNASGLPDPGQITTARDMVTLGLRLQDDFPKHYRLFSLTSFVYRGKTYRSHNTLMHGFPGMDGIKTGYTRASGFNLVSSVSADNKHVVAAVFGGKTAQTRNAHMRSLLYRALKNASAERTRESSQQLVAIQRPTKKQPPVDVAWATETQKPVKTKPVKTVKVTGKLPPPVPAVRPPPAQAQTVAASGESENTSAGEASAAPPSAAPPDAIAQMLTTGSPGPAQAPAVGGNSQVASSDPMPPSPRLDLEALRAAMSETQAQPQGPQETQGDAPQQTLQASAASAQDIAGLIRNSIVDGAPAVRPTADKQDGIPVARPPSTLNSQASALTAFATPANAAQPSHLKGPPPPSSAPKFTPARVGVGYEIQIGAYSTAPEAQSKLDAVRGRAVGLLDGHGAVTIPVQREDRKIFRARFVSFDEDTASNTCLELRRLAIDCFVMRSE
jgi:D-alanyl-D-alanine carboxypeptidase